MSNRLHVYVRACVRLREYKVYLRFVCERTSEREISNSLRSCSFVYVSTNESLWWKFDDFLYRQQQHRWNPRIICNSINNHNNIYLCSLLFIFWRFFLYQTIVSGDHTRRQRAAFTFATTFKGNVDLCLLLNDHLLSRDITYYHVTSPTITWHHHGH